jgi:CheY-like chemotaxis protein
MRTAKPLLVVDNSPEEARTVRQALQDLGMAERTIHAPSAAQALAHLHSTAAEKPALILLDLNENDTASIEFLRATKGDPSLAEIPVVVLSTSPQRQDILRSFDLHVAGYIIKPTDYAALVETVRIIHSYWSLSCLPARMN